MRIQDCVAVLRSGAKVEDAWGKHNALRTLVHLVGDIHQPLHITSGYLDTQQTDLTKFIVGDPAKIVDMGLKSDLGGNSLLFGAAASKMAASEKSGQTVTGNGFI